MNKTKNDLKNLSVTAMLCALAFISIFIFKFRVKFLTFDFKDSILTIISFLYGPLYGVAAALIVATLEFITISDTGLYGLIMNALSSATFTFTCSTIYKYRRTLLGAVIGSISSVFSMTAIMLVANIFITPLYMGVSRSDVAAMILPLLLPFNLMKGIVNASITMVIYKPTVSTLKKVGLSQRASPKTDIKKFIPLTLCALIVFIVAILVILYVLDGEFKMFVNNS